MEFIKYKNMKKFGLIRVIEIVIFSEFYIDMSVLIYSIVVY